MTSAAAARPDTPAPLVPSLASALVAQARLGISVTDPDGTILYVNQAFTDVTGYTLADALGKNPRILQSGRHPRAFYEEMWRCLVEDGAWQGEIWNRRRSGEVYPEWLSIVALHDEGGAATHYCAMFGDITDRKRAEEALAHRATHDPLTDLPNRALFLEHLRHALHLHRRSGSRLALLFLDLNGFKAINDERGHAAGDIVLRTVADRVRGWLRTSDLVARLGGDEFIVLLQGLRLPRQADHCLEKLREEIARPIPLPGGACRIEAAVGIAHFPDEAGTAELLVDLADQRMYQGKRTARSSGEQRLAPAPGA